MSTSNTVVYFMQEVREENPEEGLIKIGVTKDLSFRHHTVQFANRTKVRVVGVSAGGRKEEQAFHDQFSFARVHPDQEWFRPCPEIQTVITTLLPAPQIQCSSRLSLKLSEEQRLLVIDIEQRLAKIKLTTGQSETLKEFVWKGLIRELERRGWIER